MWLPRGSRRSRERLIPRVPQTRTLTVEIFEIVKRSVLVRSQRTLRSGVMPIFVGSRS